MRNWLITGLALGLVILAGTARASIAVPVTGSTLLLEAELIFEGVVTDVRFRSSYSAGPQKAPGVPHTFVTYRIEKIYKGAVDGGGKEITLRFLGGLNGKGHILLASNIPLFNKGDRDILFVRGNGRKACPLVGGDQGRFRVIGQAVFTDEGRTVWQTGDGALVYGDVIELPELMTRKIGKQELRRVLSPMSGEAVTRQPSGGSRRLDGKAFRSLVADGIRTLSSEGKLTAVKPVKVARSSDAFTFNVTVAPPPPQPAEKGIMPASDGKGR